MRGAQSINDRGFNERDVSAVADQRSVCVRRNLEDEPLGCGCRAHAGVGHDRPGFVVGDGVKFTLKLSHWSQKEQERLGYVDEFNAHETGRKISQRQHRLPGAN